MWPPSMSRLLSIGPGLDCRHSPPPPPTSTHIRYTSTVSGLHRASHRRGKPASKSLQDTFRYVSFLLLVRRKARTSQSMGERKQFTSLQEREKVTFCWFLAPGLIPLANPVRVGKPTFAVLERLTASQPLSWSLSTRSLGYRHSQPETYSLSYTRA